MGLFSKKSTFIIGSLIGSAVGLLFARESGKTLRSKLNAARTPQKKFEALFQEYLKIGKSAVAEAKESEAMQELMKGGKEILAELKIRAEKEGGSAVKFAHKKTAEVLKEVEKQAGAAKAKAKKRVAKAKKRILKKAAKTKVGKKIVKAKKKIAPKKKRKTKK